MEILISQTFKLTGFLLVCLVLIRSSRFCVAVLGKKNGLVRLRRTFECHSVRDACV